MFNFSDPMGLVKLLFVAVASLLVFTRIYASWPTLTRLVFASVFAAGSFVTCLAPGDRAVWFEIVQAIDLAFYTMISGVLGLYIRGCVSDEAYLVQEDPGHVFH